MAARRRVLEVGPRIESRERALRADCWTGQEPFRLRFGLRHPQNGWLALTRFGRLPGPGVAVGVD